MKTPDSVITVSYTHLVLVLFCLVQEQLLIPEQLIGGSHALFSVILLLRAHGEVAFFLHFLNHQRKGGVGDSQP